MSGQRQSLVVASLVCFGLAACGQSNQPSGETVDAAESPQPQTAEMTGDDAIEHIRTLARNGTLKASVNVKYTETSNKRVPCGAAEVSQQQSAYPSNPELWRCKSTGGLTYFKTVTATEAKCCRVKQVPIPDGVAWRATIDENDKWRVEGDFGLEGEQHHAAFVVDRQTKKVGELPL